MTAAAAGATVQLVGKIGDDEVGDAVVLALAAAGVSHVALLRDPARGTPLLVEGAEPEDLDTAGDTTIATIEPTDPDARPMLDAADVELGLRYLTDFRAIVLADPVADSVVAVAAEAARYAGAVLLGVAAPGSKAVPDLPQGSVLLAAPAEAAEALAPILGRVAAAVDQGAAAGEALERELAALGATRPS